MSAAAPNSAAPAPAAAPSAVEPVRRFRAAAGRFATGVAVITTCETGSPVGTTVNSFTTVSLDPMLLPVCLNRKSRLLQTVRRSGTFAVTVLAAEQQRCAEFFATPGRPSGMAVFAGVPFHHDVECGCPVLDGGVAYFGCVTEQLYPGGDHILVLGRVCSWGLLRDADPLLFVDGRYTGPPPV